MMGSVMDIGDGVSHIVLIYESLALHYAISCLVGSDVVEYSMMNFEQWYSLTAAGEGEFAVMLKRNCAAHHRRPLRGSVVPSGLVSA